MRSTKPKSISCLSSKTSFMMSSVNTTTAASSSETKKMVILKSSDEQIFEVEEAVALQSLTLKNMIEDDCADEIIPLPNVTGKILAKVTAYCNHHHAAKAAAEGDSSTATDEDTYDKDLCKELETDQETLFDLILTANYLNVKSLLDLTCQKVADMIKGKTPEKIRETFHIVNDYTPEEEEEVRREYKWAFE